MSGLELVGGSALYILRVVISAYVAAATLAFFNRNAGLEGIIPVIITWMAVMAFGAIAGLVLLGHALA